MSDSYSPHDLRLVENVIKTWFEIGGTELGDDPLSKKILDAVAPHIAYAAKQEVKQDSLATVCALVNMLGGEARIPEKLLVEQSQTITRWDDPETREVVLKVTGD